MTPKQGLNLRERIEMTRVYRLLLLILAFLPLASVSLAAKAQLMADEITNKPSVEVLRDLFETQSFSVDFYFELNELGISKWEDLEQVKDENMKLKLNEMFSDEIKDFVVSRKVSGF